MVVFLDKLLVDEGLLSDIGVQPGQTLQIELQSNDPVNCPLKVKPPSKPQAKLPLFIIVKSERGEFNVLGMMYMKGVLYISILSPSTSSHPLQSY